SENHDEDVGEENPMEDDEATSKFNGIDPISATLSDPKVLDCCSCCQPLTIPCEKGHFACFTCCALGRECLECSSRIPYNRCRAIEKVLESINISCLNAKYGCKETCSYSERNNHEKKCIHIPCFCPHKGCDFVASSKELSLHFSNKHKTSGIQFLYNHNFHVSVNPYDEFLVLQEQTDGNMFILKNNVVENMGNVVTISCMGPNSSQPGHAYAIVAKSQGCCLMLKSFTKNIQRGIADIPSSGFLVIPFDRSGNYAYLHLEICIRKR
ncbi:E3 ubiquitin-protein ligase SINA-like 10, partial [Gastrolobium bilobum]|uniref:E3 ubiquitin-protein ligase SINA-like 10 n=1 Tax=Gastrolobium bilobum TaxID=150636 RepID=UPI002AB06229